MYKPKPEDKIVNYDYLKFSNRVEKVRQISKFMDCLPSHCYIFGLPPLKTCKGAGECKNYCYAIWRSNFRLRRAKVESHNYYLIYNSLINNNTDELIINSLPVNMKVLRVHDSGDFINKEYMRSWLNVAKIKTDITFYAYTKELKSLYELIFEDNYKIPNNFRFIMSLDVKKSYKKYIDLLEGIIRKVYIIKSIKEAEKYKNLPYNENEYEAILGNSDFKIAIHGTVNRFKPDSEENRANKYFKKLYESGISVY